MAGTPKSQQQFVIVKTIAASATRVFDVIVSPAGMKSWIPMCRSAVWEHPLGSNDIRAGSVRIVTMQVGMVAREEMVFFEDGRQLNYTFQPPIVFEKVTTNYEGVTRVEPTGPNSSLLTWAVHFDTPGLQGLAKPLVKSGIYALINLMASNVVRLSESSEQFVR